MRLTDETDIAPRSRRLPDWLHQNRVLMVVVLLHWAAAVATGLITAIPFHAGTMGILGMLFGIMLPLFLMVVLFWRFAHLAISVRPERPIHWMIDDIRGVVTDFDRVAGGAIRLLLMVVLVGTFSYFKSIIPALNEFSWDPLFAEVDRSLIGGHDPYSLLLSVTGTPFMTSVINAAYHFWLFLVYFIILLACFAKHDRPSGDTMLLAIALTFILGGNLMATIFSSAGPVYYGRLGYGDDFAPLMRTLNEFAETSPVWALNVQDTLWNTHAASGPISGISAMPSMHMASSTLLACYGFRYARWAGWLLTGFAVVILIGSVQLAWHYAIDSYAGAMLAIILWCVASRITNRGRCFPV